MSTFVDLADKQFGRLTVVREYGRDRHGRATWLCKCECGNTTVAQSGNLRSGHTQSCGCLEKENRKKMGSRAVVKHGKTNTRLFNIWQSMLERCNCLGVGFENYGKRGITVCEEWEEFLPFEKWSYENGYDDTARRGECTLDRINVNGDYEPNNCRWVDTRTQQNNKRNNVILTYNGKTQTVAEWAREVKITPSTIHNRIKKFGWSVEEALTTRPNAVRRCSAL